MSDKTLEITCPCCGSPFLLSICPTDPTAWFAATAATKGVSLTWREVNDWTSFDDPKPDVEVGQ